ncbi:MAG: beta-ketoacyl synthase N-terminal-like domain-containing protein [Polyangiaceae bacterium]
MKTLAVIAGIGAQTPLGLSARETAFMYRTGLPAMREAPLKNEEGEATTFCTVNTLNVHALAAERALTLGIEALHECTQAQREALGAMRLNVFCCVDEYMARVVEEGATLAQTLANEVKAELRRWFGKRLDVTLHAAGAGGFGALLPSALEQLQQGETDAVLIGGLHSDYHPQRIAGLIESGRLFSREHLDAVLPGEGAALVLLTTFYLARQMKWPVYGSIHAIGAAFERATPDNDEGAYEAAGMTVALRSAMQEARSEQCDVGWQLQDIGFEGHRIAEWQTISLRTHDYWCEPNRSDSLPQRMGHLGGATLPVQLVIAAEAWLRGWAPHERVVCLSGSDSGARTALLASSQGTTSSG